MDPSYFETRFTPHRDRPTVWKAICQYLQPFIAASDTVVDIGSGYCDFINQIQAGTKYAIDLNEDGARWCAPGVTFLKSRAIEKIDLPSRSVNVIMMSNLLE